MSSLANALKRKTHKERSQPAARTKYGLLEKKKDYLLRAKDFHRKEDTIKSLQRKAEERNDDEFYFAMEKARTKGGIHAGRQAGKEYTQEQLRLMKTQDEKYLATKATSEAKKVEKLQGNLHLIGLAPQNQHTVFVDEREDAEEFSPEAYFETPAPLLGRAFNRPRREQLEASTSAPAKGLQWKDEKRLERQKHYVYRELVQRQQRQKQLSTVASKMAHDKAVMGKGRKRKLRKRELLGATDLPVFKWKRERKK